MLQPALQAVNGLLQEPGSIDLVTREAVKQVMEVKGETKTLTMQGKVPTVTVTPVLVTPKFVPAQHRES